MISVQNHQQQLSGNKSRVFFIIFLTTLLLSSCGLFSHGKKTNEPVVVKKDTHEQTTEEKKEEKTDEKKDETTHEVELKKKDSYNISYLLPFSIDEAELNQLLSEEKISGYQPLGAVEFYEGALMALDTLKKYGVNLNISVYDNKKDSLSTALLLNSPGMKNTDLVIGPVFNESLKAGAAFAKQNNIYMISPLSPSTNITFENEYYLMANSTLHTQLEKTIEFVIKTHPNANFIIVYRTEKENETKIAAEFKSGFDELKTTNPMMTLKETYSFAGISANLNATNNYVFIASNEELFVNSLLRDLSKSSRENNITLLALQSILSFESISLDYFENLHLHYPTAYYVNQDLSKVKQFNTTFTSLYDIKPSDYAYRGYDITLYFGNLLKNYGPAISSNFEKGNLMAPVMLGTFNFQPCKSGDTIKFYENQNITILKYENYKFEKAN